MTIRQEVPSPPRRVQLRPKGSRPDIEGLRAVAVLAVVLYHAEIPGITVGIASALYVGNYRFATQGTDYLASGTASPFQHYWSLGTEEQFYLLWPVLIIGTAWLLGRIGRGDTVLPVLGTGPRKQRVRAVARPGDGPPADRISAIGRAGYEPALRRRLRLHVLRPGLARRPGPRRGDVAGHRRDRPGLGAGRGSARTRAGVPVRPPGRREGLRAGAVDRDSTGTESPRSRPRPPVPAASTPI